MFFGISILRAGFEPRPIAWQRRKSPANRTLYFIGMRWVKTTPKPRLQTGADELKPEKTPCARRVPPPLRFGAALFCVVSLLDPGPRRRLGEVGFSPYLSRVAIAVSPLGRRGHFVERTTANMPTTERFRAWQA